MMMAVRHVDSPELHE